MNLLQKIFNFNKKSSKSYDSDSAWETVSSSNLFGIDAGNLLNNNKNWVFVAVDKISGATSSIPLKVMRTSKKDDGDTEIFSGPLVDFLSEPNPKISGRDFTYLSFAYKELTGNSFWELSEDKKTVSPLNPTRIKPLYEKAELIGYKYTDEGKIRPRTIEVENVLHDKYPDPSNPYWGCGTLARIASWIDTDSYATEFNRKFFLNGATFGGWIETEETSAERVKLIKEGFIRNHTGISNAHKTGILPAGAKWTANSGSMTDMQFTELDARYRDKILSAFGVPKAVAGIVDDVNRANAEASEYVFAKYTIKPRMDRFIDFINTQIVPLFDNSGQIYVAYEDFIPANQEVILRETEIALNRQPYKTINEVREDNGLTPISGGDVIYNNNAFGMPIGSPEKALPKTETVVKGAVDSMVSKLVDVVKLKTIDTEADNKSDPLIVKHKQFVSRVEAYQTSLANKVKDFNSKQKNEVIKNLNQITKAVKKGDLFDMDAEVAIMVDFVSPILGNLLKEQLVDEWDDLQFPGLPDTTEQRIKRIIDKSVNRLAKSYNDTTANLLKTAINDGIREGDSIPKIAERISMVYEFSDNSRAYMVAHTETFFTANEANREAYRQSGVVEEIKWVTAEDEMTCEFCEPLNGKTISIKENFYDKGDTARGRDGGKLPVDYRAMDNPPLHPNCVIGDTEIMSSHAQKIIKAHYSGEVVKISLSDSRSLTVTPNHVLLTNRGFITAKSLGKGDKVVDCTALQRIIFSNPDNNNSPSKIADVFTTLTKNLGVLTTSVPVSPEYLHSDAGSANGDIHVVSTDCLLTNAGQSVISKQVKESLFSSTKFSNGLDSVSDLDSMLIALAFASDGIMSIDDVFGIVKAGSLTHHKPISDKWISDYDSRLSKYSSNGNTTDIKGLGELIDRLSILVSLNEITNIEFNTFHGDVYDLSSMNTLYTANGFVSSNCRCFIQPIIKDISELSIKNSDTKEQDDLDSNEFADDLIKALDL